MPVWPQNLHTVHTTRDERAACRELAADPATCCQYNAEPMLCRFCRCQTLGPRAKAAWLLLTCSTQTAPSGGHSTMTACCLAGAATAECTKKEAGQHNCVREVEQVVWLCVQGFGGAPCSLARRTGSAVAATHYRAAAAALVVATACLGCCCCLPAVKLVVLPSRNRQASPDSCAGLDGA